MQGGWRLMGGYWMLMELETIGRARQNLPAISPTPRSDTHWSEPSHESTLLIGVLTMPTLSGGMQRWNR
ncbi:hypothetical protein HRbin15_01020 [bacterium HR15]|nr:hypothetical protein HRbin15_01020 [bacterium HR15]